MLLLGGSVCVDDLSLVHVFHVMCVDDLSLVHVFHVMCVDDLSCVPCHVCG